MIQLVSDWMVFNWRYAEELVQIWETELYKADADKMLLLVYLANDALQKARRKRREPITRAFSAIITSSLRHVFREGNKALEDKLKRIVRIWGERQVMEQTITAELMSLFTNAVTPEKAPQTLLPEATLSGDLAVTAVDSASLLAEGAGPPVPLTPRARAGNVKLFPVAQDVVAALQSM